MRPPDNSVASSPADLKGLHSNLAQERRPPSTYQTRIYRYFREGKRWMITLTSFRVGRRGRVCRCVFHRNEFRRGWHRDIQDGSRAGSREPRGRTIRMDGTVPHACFNANGLESAFHGYAACNVPSSECLTNIFRPRGPVSVQPGTRRQLLATHIPRSANAAIQCPYTPMTLDDTPSPECHFRCLQDVAENPDTLQEVQKLMTSITWSFDEREDWIEHLLSGSDVAQLQKLRSPTRRLRKIPSGTVRRCGEILRPTAGEPYAPLSTTYYAPLHVDFSREKFNTSF